MPSLNAFVPLLKRARSLSFSQYGEDVLLHTLHPQPQGFYVDVGAYHPWEGSNTYKLYLKGWSGITIEPNPDAATAFRRLRPRDTHLALGVARERGELSYHRFKDAKFNTFELDDYRRTLTELGAPEAILCLPLREVLQDHAPGRAIDLLSVDCEGLDYEVLASLDWSTTRPTVIIVEDIDQYRSVRDAGARSPIAQLLEGHGYGCVAQAWFSFVFVDREAIANPSRASGFSLADSQVSA